MGRETVLVIEDNQFNRKLVRTLLQFGEYHVLEAMDAESGIQLARQEFLKKNSLKFPIIAKPDKGYVGMGVKKIDSMQEIQVYLRSVPVDCMIQEFAGLDEEYGIFYHKEPGDKEGKVISLTHKVIPKLTGDGKATVKELIDACEEFGSNKQNVYRFCDILDYVPKNSEVVPVLTQASHTFGAKFVDAGEQISQELSSWIDGLFSEYPGVHFARFDMRMPSKDSLHDGKGAKIVELNGGLSEPLHMYDDRHTFWFGVRTLWQSYGKVFMISKQNHKMLKKKVPYRHIVKEYKTLFQTEKRLKQISAQKKGAAF